ncbi:MAG: HAMP domain-containing protein, partial [Bdellovibrionota bacterium]
MASKTVFPIRIKLLALISGLVLAATVCYLFLAVRVFQEDKTVLIYELNAANVKTLASEVDAAFSKITDKMALMTQGHREASWTKAVLETEPDLIAYTLYVPGSDSSHWNQAATIRNAEYLKLYNLPAAEIDQIRTKIPVPFVQVLAKKMIVLNSTLEGGAPILTIALAAELQGDNGNKSPAVAVADLRADRFIKLFSQQGIASVYLIDSQGHVLVHPDSKLLAARASLGDVPIVRDAVDSPLAFQEKRFHYQGADWLGAYAKAPGGNLIVVSQVEQKEAFLAAARLIEKSALFAIIILTASLLISGLFARGLTEPIQQLVAATERVSRWDFSQSVNVKTRDEIASLARSFNAMSNDLQAQRTQLEQSKNELELKVQERTAALESQKRQIAESQETMVRTTRLASLGELAGAAAHEVLNPVNNMNIRIEKIRNHYGKADLEEIGLLREI